MLVEQRAGELPLGPGFAQDIVTVGAKLPAPLGVGLGHRKAAPPSHSTSIRRTGGRRQLRRCRRLAGFYGQSSTGYSSEYWLWLHRDGRTAIDSRYSGGAGGIRTLDTLLPYTHFPGERLRPLGHRSACRWKARPSRRPRADRASLPRSGRSPYAGGDAQLRTAAYRRRDRGDRPRARSIALPEPFARKPRRRRPARSRNSPTTRRCDALGIERPVRAVAASTKACRSTERSVDQSGTLPERIRLFRRPILDEWAGGDETLEHLVAHVADPRGRPSFRPLRRRHARARGQRRVTRAAALRAT